MGIRVPINWLSNLANESSLLSMHSVIVYCSVETVNCEGSLKIVTEGVILDEIVFSFHTNWLQIALLLNVNIL